MMGSGLRRAVIAAVLGFFFFASTSWATTTASRPAPYPNYEVGDLASLVVSTSPPQPSAPVYMYRLKNGAPDGPQPQLVGTTDAAGRFELLNVPLPASQVGEFTREQYAVGSPSAPLSSPLAFRIDASSAPTVTRAAPFPNYQVGDTASVTVRTLPAQAGQAVYRWRLRNGVPDGAQPTLVGTTNSVGRWTLSAFLPASVAGSYSGERYAVGTTTGPRSPSTSYTIAPAPNAPTVSRPAPFPDYQIGDTAVLEIATNPVQADAPVYRWRLKDGLPDGSQPLLVGTTDASGRFTQTAPLVSGVEGSYTGERYAVGRTTNPRSTALIFTIAPAPNAPTVNRPAPFPDYQIGDTAKLILTTNPVQPNAPVYRWRWHDGRPEWPNPSQEGTTDASGRFEIEAQLAAGVEGSYTRERYAVGRTTNPRSPALSFTISPAPNAPIVSRPSPFPHYQVGDTATLTIATDPPQPDAPVYRWRLLDGQPDGSQPTLVGTTTSTGTFTQTAGLPASVAGSYTGEQYAVGRETNPRSSSLAFEIYPANPNPGVPIVERPAPFPSYTVGDTARLVLRTDPRQPNEPVYRFRLKDGQPDGPQPTLEGTTDELGRLELEALLPAEAEGIYTEEQYAVGEPSGPLSPPRSFTVSSAGPTGELRFDEITPNTMDTGVATVVTLRGENFTEKSTVRLLDETGDQFADSKLADSKSVTTGTTATVLSVTPDGREMQVEIDATYSQAVDAFGMIAVDNGSGEKAQPLRVVGPEPIVDAWRPGVTARGGTYILNLVGVHLADASILPPTGVSLQVQEQADKQVTGLLTIGDNAPLGTQVILVQGDTQTVQVPFTIEASPSPESTGTNLLLGTKAEADARAAGAPMPKLLVQPLVIGEHLRTRVDSSGTERSMSKAGCFVLSARWTLIDLTAQVAIVVDLDTGTVGAITRTLPLGGSVNLGSYVLSFSLKVDLTFNWVYCSSGFGDLVICLEYDYEIEIPGRVWRYERGTCFTLGVVQGESQGETSRLEFIGGPCAQAENDPVADGIATATVTQTACCQQDVAFEAEGISFGSPFALGFGSAVSTTPDACVANEIRIRDVSFTGDHTMLEDFLATTSSSGVVPGGSYQIDDPVWTDADGDGTPETNQPVAYTRNKRVEVELKLAIDPPLEVPLTVDLRGVGPDGIIFEANGVTLNGAEHTELIVSDLPLPNETAHYQPFGIAWSFSQGGSTYFEPIGDTEHEMYVTLADPILGLHPPYRTSIDLAVGDGFTDVAGVGAFIWNQFEGPAGVHNWQGRPLSYYPTGTAFGGCALDETDLLTGTGAGRCGSFAQLFKSVMEVHGIEVHTIVVEAKDGTRMLVKNWTYGKPSFPTDPEYKWILVLVAEPTGPGMVPPKPGGVYGDMTSGVGIPGQNSPTPSEKAHENHAIVLVPAPLATAIGAPYVDPSYGVTFADESDFETKAIDGYYSAAYGLPPLAYLVKQPVSGMNNIRFCPLATYPTCLP